MKRADIKPGTDYAVSVKVNHYDKANTIVRGTVVGFPDNYVEVYLTGEAKHRRVTPANVLSTWAKHEAREKEKALAITTKRERERQAWEAKRAEERQRFEQSILPAFKGLPTTGHVSGRVDDPTVDLATFIEDTMLHHGSTTVTLCEADLTAIAARILELQAIAEQSAMVAGDPPEAGWSPLTNMHRLEREIAARLEEAAEAEAQTGRKASLSVHIDPQED